MASLNGIFVNSATGRPVDGATAKLWRYEAFASPPAKNQALPSSTYQVGAAVTTGASHGSDGAYRFNGVPVGSYWISIEYNGNIGWEAAQVGSEELANITSAIEQITAAGSGLTTTLNGQELAGSDTLEVADATGFQVGDSIFIGASGDTDAESQVVESVDTGTDTIVIVDTLTNSHAAGTPVSRSPVELVQARNGYVTLGDRLDTVPDGFVNANTFDLNADGTTDDHASLQAAADLAGQLGLLFVPPGEYRINDTLNIQGACEMQNVTLNYSGSGTGVRVRNGNDSTLISRKRLSLPRVISVVSSSVLGRSETHIGIEVYNTQTSDIYVPHVRDFGIGLLVTASSSAGNAYNTYHLGHLDNNKIGMELDPADAGSWTNENLFLGGRISINSGEGTNISGARHIQLIAANSPANNNVWLRTSLEGSGPAFTVRVQGPYNEFIGCRWEGTPKVWFEGADAHSNVIFYGYDSHAISFTEDGGAEDNNAFLRSNIRMEGGGSSGVYIGSNGTSSDNPVFAAMGAGKGITDAASTDYGWRAGHNYMEVKATADTGPRLRINNASGRIEGGDGAGTIFGSQLGLEAGRVRIYTGDLIASSGIIAVKGKAGAFNDTDIVGAAPSNIIGGIDTTNSRLYIKHGGAWHYIAQTAGFQIPEFEKVCPQCGNPMDPGQRVVGRIESVMDDDARHGLWEHLTCPE